MYLFKRERVHVRTCVGLERGPREGGRGREF